MEEVKNIAIIGCGYWGPNHVRVFSELEQSRVIAVVDKDPAQVARLTAQYPMLRGETDYQNVLADPEVHAVVVETPATEHFPIVRDALRMGKHVLCEKPLCRLTEQATELACLAEHTGLTLMVGHIFLFNEAVIALKEMVRSDALGRIRHLMAIRTNLGPVRSDVNAAYDLAGHDIAIFNWLLDAEPTNVSARGAAYLQPEIEDVASIVLAYPNSVFAALTASWLSPLKVRHIAIVGDERMLTWDDSAPAAPITVFDKGAAVHRDQVGRECVAIWNRAENIIPIQPHEPLKRQAEHFLRRLSDPASEPRSEGLFAAGVVRTLEAVYRSMHSDGTAVTPL
jgi:predicted dehydrogenase